VVHCIDESIHMWLETATSRPHVQPYSTLQKWSSVHTHAHLSICQ